MPDVMADAGRFEECGISLGRMEMYKVMLAMQKLVESHPLERIRFFGKIYGLKAPYYVVEAVYKDGERPFDAPEGAAADARAADSGYDEYDGDYSARGGRAADGQPGEAGGDGFVPPASQHKAPPQPPMEEFEGANKYAYFVCSFPGGEWTKLPDVTPKQIVAARAITKFFTGSLDAPVESYPPFPGTEKNYLRAQIARIVAATAVAPAGRYVDPAELESLDGGEDDDNVSVVSNMDFNVADNEEIGEPAGWIHRERFILPQGRCFWWEPPRDDASRDESEFDEESMLSANAPEPEFGPPLLTPLADDEPIGAFPAWSVRYSSAVATRYATILMQSNRWPGAYAYANGRSSACIYVGYGQKYQPTHFTPQPPPQPPPQPAAEYAGDDIVERADATDERDALLRGEDDDVSYASGSEMYSDDR
ncbi:radial spoke protein RSP4/6 [Thecamonas trahens ATCC 50062]|uniref:Radial spoke protein RSP4/6 n=1 Tax=Thecamonas trahens ATCC 50062 TaxID=461836 RepID=A0A0L0D559_THETB|nr:radial spoke protein RSP4/6 [Thecamonas trahens ATCC 50062]KNC46438.1 radial spoke protein RSP4/6 [Thecamonas trahens ATCC 50062]|eukprot:XP_013760729.1 radial spoke protein RSP4/6 [Thecamonas trahens ATCC 50062]